MTGLYHGDCLNVMKDLPERSVDLILCDLPYACGKTKHKWDKEIDLAALWKAYNRLLKPDGIVCLFGNEPFTSKLIQSNTDMFRYKLIYGRFKRENKSLTRKRENDFGRKKTENKRDLAM